MLSIVVMQTCLSISNITELNRSATIYEITLKNCTFFILSKDRNGADQTVQIQNLEFNGAIVAHTRLNQVIIM